MVSLPFLQFRRVEPFLILPIIQLSFIAGCRRSMTCLYPPRHDVGQHILRYRAVTEIPVIRRPDSALFLHCFLLTNRGGGHNALRPAESVAAAHGVAVFRIILLVLGFVILFVFRILVIAILRILTVTVLGVLIVTILGRIAIVVVHDHHLTALSMTCIIIFYSENKIFFRKVIGKRQNL